MPKAQATSTLSGLIDTDMEDDTLNGEAFPTPDSNRENSGSAKKAGGRTKASAKRFTKIKSATKQAKVAPQTVPKSGISKKTNTKRAPLTEQHNGQAADETEEVDEFAEQADPAAVKTVADAHDQPKQRGRRKGPVPKAKKPVEIVPPNSAGEMAKDGEFEYTPTSTRTTRRGRPPIADKMIPETQVAVGEGPPMLDQMEQEELPHSVLKKYNKPGNDPQRRQQSVPRHRAGSVSDGEGLTTDPALRRKLGEMNKKFESLDAKYHKLRDIGIKEAEANFEKLRVQSEAKAKAAEELISSMKKELTLQKSLSADANSIRAQISTRDAELSKTRSLADSLSASLAEAQNENKALQAKLAASRNMSTAVESLGAKTPGSAMRARQQQTAGPKTLIVGSAEAAQAAQIAQLKEDLYSDLTGLILRGVERSENDDIYDCLQTGRNGTLHFKLSVAKDSEEGYDNTEFQYTPRLDENRDRDLIALLPEYLTEEITFSRTNAAMFYGRVVETLMKRRRVDEE